MANYFSQALHGKSIAGAKKLNSAKMSLYKHQEDIIIAMPWQLGHTAYRRKSPKSSVFKGIVTAMFGEVMMLLVMLMNIILTTVTIIIERSKAKCLFGASTSALFQQPSPWANTGYH